MNERRKAALIGEISNQETHEATFAVAAVALIEAVEHGFRTLAAQLDALGKLHGVGRQQVERLIDEVAETAAAVNQQTGLLSKVHNTQAEPYYE